MTTLVCLRYENPSGGGCSGWEKDDESNSYVKTIELRDRYNGILFDRTHGDVNVSFDADHPADCALYLNSDRKCFVLIRGHKSNAKVVFQEEVIEPGDPIILGLGHGFHFPGVRCTLSTQEELPDTDLSDEDVGPDEEEIENGQTQEVELGEEEIENGQTQAISDTEENVQGASPTQVEEDIQSTSTPVTSNVAARRVKSTDKISSQATVDDDEALLNEDSDDESVDCFHAKSSTTNIGLREEVEGMTLDAVQRGLVEANQSTAGTEEEQRERLRKFFQYEYDFLQLTGQQANTSTSSNGREAYIKSLRGILEGRFGKVLDENLSVHKLSALIAKCLREEIGLDKTLLSSDAKPSVKNDENISKAESAQSQNKRRVSFICTTGEERIKKVNDLSPREVKVLLDERFQSIDGDEDMLRDRLLRFYRMEEEFNAVVGDETDDEQLKSNLRNALTELGVQSRRGEGISKLKKSLASALRGKFDLEKTVVKNVPIPTLPVTKTKVENDARKIIALQPLEGRSQSPTPPGTLVLEPVTQDEKPTVATRTKAANSPAQVKRSTRASSRGASEVCDSKLSTKRRTRNTGLMEDEEDTRKQPLKRTRGTKKTPPSVKTKTERPVRSDAKEPTVKRTRGAKVSGKSRKEREPELDDEELKQPPKKTRASRNSARNTTRTQSLPTQEGASQTSRQGIVVTLSGQWTSTQKSKYGKRLMDLGWDYSHIEDEKYSSKVTHVVTGVDDDKPFVRRTMRLMEYLSKFGKSSPRIVSEDWLKKSIESRTKQSVDSSQYPPKDLKTQRDREYPPVDFKRALSRRDALKKALLDGVRIFIVKGRQGITPVTDKLLKLMKASVVKDWRRAHILLCTKDIAKKAKLHPDRVLKEFEVILTDQAHPPVYIENWLIELVFHQTQTFESGQILYEAGL
mmetsp:Transcript_455/g.620  ORF Transcript_455/g.620 Transcript_455/m.620 type:complete len:916 (-) Transcript_455:713-3460(-)|eukprot:CAMPEP_0203751766 /NCGR_PEP_ID=MMETSP0098-20131031/5783_1 /ASSEMBLY_ACC=CAM_ASM_000208 /TAXON_ID=96639 /ORGANISM=" , Strain NY0313808BC1" /LENGTH=915 /DNA_ID=CAMNT_0050641639 /DNA_START=377 /DNA_END=3124 /DNA_ORIENTATION=+